MSTGEAPAALQRLLGGEALAALRLRLRRVYENAATEAPASVRLARLAAHEREALALLAGRPHRLSTSMALELGAIDDGLRRAGLASGLRDALERLDGPLRAPAAERAAAAALWPALAAAHAALQPGLQSPQGLGLLKRLGRQDIGVASVLCDQAGAVLQALPAHGQPRARLAASVLGNAHALDDGQPVATLVLAVLRQRLADEAASNRALWASCGVSVNALARPALALNLPLSGGEAAASAEPAYWSLRQLLRSPPAWRVRGRTVFVCENPNIVAIAADALGAACAPLVCTDGMPAAAQRTLLAQLAGQGARLRYHGDFDWPGIAIANQVLRQPGARAWRMAAADYAQALAGAASAPLDGTPVAALWDAALKPAMQAAQRAVAEESLAELLLADLAVAAG